MMMTFMSIHFWLLNKGYTHETATYEVLSEYQGAAIPDYYGSYSLDRIHPGAIHAKD